MRYANLLREVTSVLDAETNITARMATIAAMAHDAFDAFFWTGFYLVDETRSDELVIGPYQGTLGCLRIKFGQGVCGAAASSRKTQIVQDVHDFPGHIACDPRSRSEIVLPVFDKAGGLRAVFDVDSEKLAAFDGDDEAGLRPIVSMVFA
ncbi:MAG: GAF domain-containing protein [Pseudomonadota bacterium]